MINAKSLFAATAFVALGITVIVAATQTRAARGTTAIETVVPTDFGATWDLLIRELNSGEFQINATIKENSTIRVLL